MVLVPERQSIGGSAANHAAMVTWCASNCRKHVAQAGRLVPAQMRCYLVSSLGERFSENALQAAWSDNGDEGTRAEDAFRGGFPGRVRLHSWRSHAARAGFGVDALVQFFVALWARRDIGCPRLIGIGYVVVSIAVFDVAKYLIEEEVMREREMRVASETRRSLTRFISTIAIAVFLEALVMVFRVSQEKISDLVFPKLLLFAGMALVLTLGVYQRLSAMVEVEVEHRDKAQEKKQAK